MHSGVVVFHSILVAMRSQDEGAPITNIRDHKIKGEEEEFGGYATLASRTGNADACLVRS